MRGASRTQNDSRLADRNAQTLSWAAPLPDFSRDPVVRAPLMRSEWETRDTINNRAFADTMASGPKAVTSASLAGHPTNGAMMMNPSSGRQDQRPYVTDQYFPDARPGNRPARPPHSLFQNAWLDGFDVESRDVTRELRGAVKEENRSRDADISHRLVGRTFEHQWLPAAFGAHVAHQIDASVALRPAMDDYQKTWRPTDRNGT